MFDVLYFAVHQRYCVCVFAHEKCMRTKICITFAFIRIQMNFLGKRFNCVSLSGQLLGCQLAAVDRSIGNDQYSTDDSQL